MTKQKQLKAKWKKQLKHNCQFFITLCIATVVVVCVNEQGLLILCVIRTPKFMFICQQMSPG